MRFQGVIPSPIATASADGQPHTTYLSIVWHVDEERIALSNQFMNKTVANMRENPNVVVRVVDPETMTDYDITAQHVRSETSGPLYDAMRDRLDAVAAQSGMEAVFRLRSAEVLRVTQCRPAVRPSVEAVSQAPSVDVLAGLEVFGRRMASCRSLDEATRVGLESIEDVFGFGHSMLLLADAAEQTSLLRGRDQQLPPERGRRRDRDGRRNDRGGRSSAAAGTSRQRRARPSPRGGDGGAWTRFLCRASRTLEAF